MNTSTLPVLPTRARWIPWVLGLAGTVWLTGTALGGAAYLRPDLWLVEEVCFDGNERATPAELRHLADLRNGTTIWGADLSAVERGVSRHPWIAEAHAYRSWPATVVVEVVERHPVALATWKGELVYIGSDGSLFARARSEDLDYPILTGLDPTLAELHPDLPRYVVRDALALLADAGPRGNLPADRISEVAFSRTTGFTLTLRSGARVALGLSGVPERLDRLAALQARGLDLSHPVWVDLGPDSVAIVHPIEAPGGEG